MPRRKLLTCKALSHVLEPLAKPDTEVTVLDIALHVSPEKLRQRLMETVARIEEPGVPILLGYGLCGRALEGVVSNKSTLILPRVDDCVGALLGSRQRHQNLLKQKAGCYFLEQHWLDTELNIFVQATKGLDRIPPKRRDTIIKLALKHYTALGLLSSRDTCPEADGKCLGYARTYGLEYIHLKTDPGLLTRLISGPWADEDFVVCPPARPIPLF